MSPFHVNFPNSELYFGVPTEFLKDNLFKIISKIKSITFNHFKDYANENVKDYTKKEKKKKEG